MFAKVSKEIANLSKFKFHGLPPNLCDFSGSEMKLWRTNASLSFSKIYFAKLPKCPANVKAGSRASSLKSRVIQREVFTCNPSSSSSAFNHTVVQAHHWSPDRQHANTTRFDLSSAIRTDARSHVLFDSFRLAASRIFEIRFRKFRFEPCAPISRTGSRWHLPDASLDPTLNSNRACVGVRQSRYSLDVSYRIVSYRRNYE